MPVKGQRKPGKRVGMRKKSMMKMKRAVGARKASRKAKAVKKVARPKARKAKKAKRKPAKKAKAKRKGKTKAKGKAKAKAKAKGKQSAEVAKATSAGKKAKKTAKSKPLLSLVGKSAAPVKRSTTKSKLQSKKSGASNVEMGQLNISDASAQGFIPYEEKPGEEYMNHSQREHFRMILNQRRQELMEEVDRTKHHMQDESSNFADPNDRATQEEEFGLELRARDRERKLIKKIEEALQRLDNNEYGYCEACGVEIGIRRLEARPTATLCIDCKTLDEIKERQTAA